MQPTENLFIFHERNLDTEPVLDISLHYEVSSKSNVPITPKLDFRGNEILTFDNFLKLKILEMK